MVDFSGLEGLDGSFYVGIVGLLVPEQETGSATEEPFALQGLVELADQLAILVFVLNYRNLAGTVSEDKLCVRDDDSSGSRLVAHGDDVEGGDCLFGEDAVDGDAGHGQFVHLLVKGVNGQDGALEGVVDCDEKEVVRISGIGGGDEMERVVRDPLLLDFRLEHHALALFFLHLIISIHADEPPEPVKNHAHDRPLGLEHLLRLRTVAPLSPRFTVNEEQTGWIILGCVLALLISILSIALPAIKAKTINLLFSSGKKSSLLIKSAETEEDTENENVKFHSVGEILFHSLYIFVYSCMHILTMMLIMTYNGYVIIVVILGLTVGHATFGMEADKDKNIPVNCCA
jgi:hypothetical protein